VHESELTNRGIFSGYPISCGHSPSTCNSGQIYIILKLYVASLCPKIHWCSYQDPMYKKLRFNMGVASAQRGNLMLGANRAAPKNADGRVTLPEETSDERQERIVQQQSKRLASILNEISGHLGHWTDAKHSSLDSSSGGYEPAMRFPEALADLKKMLMPQDRDEQASEEVARLVEQMRLVQKHLAPLFTALPLPRHLTSALHLGSHD